jgi:hypothetical protein
MPPTTRVSVKASFVYFCLGSAIGALLLVNRWVTLWPELSALRSSHVVFVVDGWVTQLILGVGWWLLPPLQVGAKPGGASWRRGQTQRGSEPLFWVVIGLLNAGIVMRAVGDPLYEWTGIGFFYVLTQISPFLLLAAAVTFVVLMWGRVRELRRK